MENDDDNKKTCISILLVYLFTINYLNFLLQVEKDSKISTKLCLKCYKKILAFYKFKSLALNSDAYLKSVDIKNEVYLEEHDIKIETEAISGDEGELKEELDDDICLKRESPENDFHSASEEEFLNVIKKIKYEYVEDAKENGMYQ